MNHAAFFNGIGGFQLAAEWVGWNNVMSCEINEFCNKITKYHFPNCTQHGDIKTTDFTVYKGRIDIVTGGVPCQPFSAAGKRLGKEDDRHLWPSYYRAIIEICPGWVVIENVSGLLNWNGGMVLNEIKADLEAAGFEVLPPLVLPACAVNAPHRRDRVWIVAYNNSFIRGEGRDAEPGKQPRYGESILPITTERFAADTNGTEPGTNIGTDIGTQGEIRRGNKGDVLGGFSEPGDAANTYSNIGCKGRMHQTEQQEAEGYISTHNARSYQRNTWENFPTQSPICSRDDGLSYGLDGITFSKWRNESIKAYGNAIVPQVALQIFKAIASMEVEIKNVKPKNDMQCVVVESNSIEQS